MKKTIRYIFLILFIWIALSAFSTVNAASATIKANKTTATVGDTVKVTVTVNSASWNLAVSGSASDTIVGYNSDAENQTTTKTYTIDTSKVGTYKVTLSGDITDGKTDSNTTINTSVSVTVKAKTTTTNSTTSNNDTTSSNSSSSTTNSTKNETTIKTKSNNAYLSTLGVTPKEYDFSGFSKTKTSYSVTVPSDVDSLKVAYKTADSKATVKVSGNSGFEVGSNNKITVKVTAEDGKTTKTYTIKVTKLATEEETQGNLIEDEGIYLTSLDIEGVSLSPEFAKDVYSYNATLSDSSLNELEVKAESNNKDAKIDISGNTNLVDGENTINIILTMEGSTVQTVYQVVVTKAAVAVADTKDVSTDNTDLMGVIKKYVGVGIGVVAFIILAIIVLIVLLIKENKKLKEDEDLEVKEYNVYENDENEFFNNIEKDNFIESLYKQRNGDIDEEELTESEKETLEEISNQTYDIFRDKVQGQSVEYSNEDFEEENPLIERRKRRGRGKGKHSL